ncbi:MAG: ATP-binding protein [Thermoleophilaceae bacterium]
MTIEANPGRLREAREWARQAALDAGFDEAGCYQMRLAMSEAVANAIQHGSQARSDCIRLEAFEDDGALVFEVRDTGTFTPRPGVPSGVEAEGGRGLELLALMMDEVQLSSTAEGSRVRFSKRLP